MPSSVEEAAYGTAMPSSPREMFGLCATGYRDASGTAGERAGSTGTSSPPNSGERTVVESANSNSENLAAQDQSTGDLIRQLSEHVSRLVRDEVKVAQLEMTRKGKQAGLGVGLLGGSGLIALYGVACLLAGRGHRPQRGGSGLAGGPDRRHGAAGCLRSSRTGRERTAAESCATGP